jgi:hypothetical protein
MKQLVNKLGISDKVIFKGLVTPQEAKMLLDESHCFVHHSITSETGDSEACTNSIMEAMAMELPCFPPGMAAFPKWWQNGVHGFLVHAKDIDNLGRKNVGVSVTGASGNKTVSISGTSLSSASTLKTSNSTSTRSSAKPGHPDLYIRNCSFLKRFCLLSNLAPVPLSPFRSFLHGCKKLRKAQSGLVIFTPVFQFIAASYHTNTTSYWLKAINESVVLLCPPCWHIFVTSNQNTSKKAMKIVANHNQEAAVVLTTLQGNLDQHGKHQDHQQG